MTTLTHCVIKNTFGNSNNLFKGRQNLNTKIEKKLRSVATPNSVIFHFQQLYEKCISGQSTYLDWSKIQLLNQDEISSIDFTNSDLVNVGIENINSVAILKLNGGLGTSMGLSGPKSLLKVINEYTFLDIILMQMDALERKYNYKNPLLLMNSFSTDAQTATFLEGKKYRSFLQHQFPRLNKKTLDAFEYPQDINQEWNPPGHGDVYWALNESGLLQELLDNGVEHLFISNVDNLGASFDPGIYGYFLNSKLEFMLELTPKTAMDVKGGTVVHYEDKLRLLERAQVAPEHLSDFEDMSTFSVFNTNSLWVSLRALKQKLDSHALHLDLIQNEKVVDGHAVIQLETAMGAAISHFERSGVVKVNRQRFLPVKKTSDLLVMRSDLVTLHQNGQVEYKGGNGYPQITLSQIYNDINTFNACFQCVPSMKHVKELTINSKTMIDKDLDWSGSITIG